MTKTILLPKLVFFTNFTCLAVKTPPRAELPIEFYLGGCSPMAIRACRRLVNGRRFSFKASTVARPMAVLPMIKVNVSSQIKCSSQLIVRRLNKEESCNETGSINAVLSDLIILHPRQAKAKLKKSLEPFLESGRICSMENGSVVKSAGLLQYSQ